MERKFRLLISKGNIDEVIYFYNNNDFEFDYYKAFETACMFGNINVAKWLYETSINNNSHFNIHRNTENLLAELVGYKQNEVVKWIVEDLYGTISNIQDPDRFFMCICQSGNLELAKWFMSKVDYDIDIHLWNNQIFRFISGNRNLEFIKWFITLDTIESFNIHSYNNQIFKIACLKKNIELLKWLITLDTVESFNIHYNNNQLVRNIGVNNRDLNLVKWLLSLDTIESFDIHCNNNEIIENITKYMTNSELLKWFLTLDTIESFTNDCDLFAIACNNQKLENAKYLWSLDEVETNIHYNNNEVMKYYYNEYRDISENDIKFFNWVISLDTKESFMSDLAYMDIRCLYLHSQYYEQIITFFGIENFEVKFQFAYFCRIGNLDEIERIYKNNTIDIHLGDNIFFMLASFNGHLNVVKWLLSTSSFDDLFDPTNYEDYHYILRRICIHGHVDIVKFLVDMDDTKRFLSDLPTGIHYRTPYGNNTLLGEICGYKYNNNKKPMIDWLISQGILSSVTKDDLIKMLKSVRINNDIELFQWILSLDDTIDIHLDNDIILNNAIRDDNPELVKFILSLDSIDNFDIYTILLKNTVFLNSKYDRECNKIMIETYKKTHYINNFIFRKIKKYNLDDHEIYFFVDDDHLNDDEKEMKYKLKKSVNIIETFLFKCYYKPGGFNTSHIIKKMIECD